MGLTLAELLPDYTASLNSARSIFGEDGSDDQAANLTRHLRTAAAAIALDKRPRTRQAVLTLVAGQAGYTDVPADLLLPKIGLWGMSQQERPWCNPPGALPTLTLADDADGARTLTLTPAPSAAQIVAYGSAYGYYYLAAHQITDDASTSTVQLVDRDLLILRAQVEAMRETAMRNAHMPVTLRDGGGGIGRNTTPAALYEKLLEEYRSRP